MYQKVRTYVKEHGMLRKQDKVLVGVSGGADSICLLFVLLDLKKEFDFSLTAVHVHHGLRGESADRDEAFVKEICEKQDVELLVFHENVREYAAENGYTEEEAGRILRRSIFTKVLEEKNADKIALAHHENDNVETLLWNLCRGTGLRGLGGIRPVTGKYVRPLLCVSRKEIERYLEEKGISYCIDETNLSDDYTRNRIRNHVIPYLEEQVNEKAVHHMSEAMANICRLHEYVEEEVGKYVKSSIVYEDNKWKLNEEKYFQIPDVFRGDVIHEFLSKAAGRKKDIESVHIHIVEELFGKQTGRKADLPYGLLAMRTYDGIELVEKKQKSQSEPMANPRIRVFDRSSEMVTFPEKAYTKWFDYDIIKCAVKIRHRESGDYIVINKQGKTQKLKQYFINEKIPQDMRDKILLVADGNQIMWIVGYRQNQAYQITEKTTKIMEISFEEQFGKEIRD